MGTFYWHLFLTFVWTIASGEISLFNLTTGFVLAYFVLWFFHASTHGSSYFVKVQQVLRFLAFFTWEVFKANLRVAYDVVTPTFHMKPGIIALPLDARTDIEILAYTNMLTLTPGTLSLDVSPDRKTLYLHVMYIDIDDLDKLKQDIKDRFERRMLEVLR